jgi:hypothetical protein
MRSKRGFSCIVPPPPSKFRAEPLFEASFPGKVEAEAEAEAELGTDGPKHVKILSTKARVASVFPCSEMPCSHMSTPSSELRCCAKRHVANGRPLSVGTPCALMALARSGFRTAVWTLTVGGPVGLLLRALSIGSVGSQQ